jgi:hypothetical protein
MTKILVVIKVSSDCSLLQINIVYRRNWCTSNCVKLDINKTRENSFATQLIWFSFIANYVDLVLYVWTSMKI